MEEDKNENAKGKKGVKKESRKTTLIFLVIMLVSGFVGGIVSVLIGHNEDTVGKVGDIIQEGLMKGSFYALPILGVLFILIAYLIYKKQIRKLRQLDEDDIESLNKIEWNLGISISLLSLWTIVSCLLYGLAIMGENRINTEHFGVRMFITSFFFMVSAFVAIFLQRCIVNFMKSMNPEKKGDVLSMHFQKEWINSCDELEKMLIYKSAYKSYSVMQIVFVIAFAVVMFASLYFEVSAFTFFIVMALWIILNLVYMIESMKLSRPKKN